MYGWVRGELCLVCLLFLGLGLGPVYKIWGRVDGWECLGLEGGESSAGVAPIREEFPGACSIPYVIGRLVLEGLV